MKALAIFLCIALTASCAKNNLSERDAKREQLKSAAETKRKELQAVAGEYSGVFSQSSGSDIDASLVLEIKDIPTSVDGQVDPISVPTLKGVLRIQLGGSDYIGFPVDKADFDPKRNKLDVVATHSELKDVLLAAQLQGAKLNGSWTAPSIASGTFQLDRNQTVTITQSLKGTYQGRLTNTHPQSSLPERLLISLVTAQDPANPTSVVVSGSMRLYVGPFGSLEYEELPFTWVQFNVFKRRLIAKTTKEPKLTLNGEVESDKISGAVLADGLGEVGTFEVKKQ